MRASRLLSILMLLQLRGRLTAESLAAEFEVSVRTIYRDIDQLSAAGVPVYADRGPGGGFALLDGYRTRLTGMTPIEAEALFLAGLPGPAAELGLGEAMLAAQLKLLSALPAGWGSDARRVAEAFHLDATGWYQRGESVALLPEVARAIWARRRIRIGYESWERAVERTLDPLGVVLKAGAWYLVARAGQDVRTYKVAAIHTFAELDEEFARPGDFDLPAYWAASLERFEASLRQGQARIRLSPHGARRMASFGQAAVETVNTALPDAGGWREAVIAVEGVDNAAAQFLALGRHVEILGPPELRAKLRDLAREIAARHE
ncbi:MAG TPA: WYL domain-containing protein [Phenylobacterium sp.]|jgi:predicted DNA-binding transcriptional regulator YafY